MDRNFSFESSKPMTVYVWDMDETLILLKSLLDGTYAEAFNGSKDKRKGIEIGKQWENHILQVCDEHFFYEEIEDYNEPYLDALNEYDDGRDLSKYNFHNDGFGFPYDDWNKRKMAYRHRAIKEKYSQGLYKILDQQTVKSWNDMYDLTDSYTDGWLSSAHAMLKQTLKRTKCQNINVLVTSGSLIPSLVKCLLYQLDDVIPANNVYSSWEVGKLRCFSWIKERFGSENVRFCVIGDGNEECEAAQTMGWPFIRIDHQPSSPYRFPGLTMKSVQSYIDVAYESSDANVEETIE
ncbi:protein phosphatase EYA-like isoform X1 [Curcuma longa]|uniref:protein phosphatase EYA-like isoform X1 n=1 Tax=Curcuma longa TaxID=136217 RepID=UPI003D9EF94F